LIKSLRYKRFISNIQGTKSREKNPPPYNNSWQTNIEENQKCTTLRPSKLVHAFLTKGRKLHPSCAMPKPQLDSCSRWTTNLANHM